MTAGGNVLADHPEVSRALDEAWGAAWKAVDPVLLDLCRLRIATLLGAIATPLAVPAGDERVVDLARWPTAPAFDATERACLAFAEQFVIDVAGLDDATAVAVADALGEQGLADFTSALLVVEQRLRLEAVWSALFGAGA